MRGVQCLRAGDLLERRASGLSESERLRLEDHLSGCPLCAEEASMLSQMRLRVTADTTELSVEARERVISSALREAAREAQAPSPGRRAVVAGGFAMAAAAALALGYGLTRQTPEPQAQQEARESASAMAHASAPAAQPSAAAEASPTEARGRRLLSGRLQSDSGELVAGDAIEDGLAVRAPEGATLQLGRARVTLHAASAVRYVEGAGERPDTLELRSGRVLCEVQPQAEAPRFAVRTEHLTAVVLGTRFEVSEQQVVVYEGRVRVETPDGEVLSEGLGAGERFELPAAPSGRAASRTRAESQRDSAVAEALLGDARRKLAGGQLEQARSAVAQALRQPLAPALRAEALTLQAESDRLAGRAPAALRTYLRVAARYRALPAGENALFAAARLAASGDPAAGRRLFERYLTRYPNGRFAADARSRLSRLPSEPAATP